MSGPSEVPVSLVLRIYVNFRATGPVVFYLCEF